MAQALENDEKTAIQNIATQGITDLIAWAEQKPRSNYVPKSQTWAYEVCRQQLQFDTARGLDSIVHMYKSSSVMPHYFDLDKSQELFRLNDGELDITVLWGIFRAPIPLVKDRDTCCIKCSQLFVNNQGRRGFARLIKSIRLRSLDYRNGYVRAEVNSWGVVYLESNESNIVNASAIVNIDWKGTMPTWVAARMTSQRAQCIKKLPMTLELIRKQVNGRCSMCLNKPKYFDKNSQLAPCAQCEKPLCVNCRSISFNATCRRCTQRQRDRSKQNYLSPHTHVVMTTRKNIMDGSPHKITTVQGVLHWTFLTSQLFKSRHLSFAPYMTFDPVAVVAKAAQGLKEIIDWADNAKLTPRAITSNYEACRHQLELTRAKFDDLIRLYQSPDDTTAMVAHVHVDKSQALYPLQAPDMQVALRWGVFKAPMPFMRDRDATYIESSKVFTDRHGRKGFARYITSQPMASMNGNQSYFRADIRLWGVVIVESSDPLVLNVSSLIDIDWKMPTYVASLMTSKRVQSIKQLAPVLRASNKLLLTRCSMCFANPASFDKKVDLVPCLLCKKPLCPPCRSIGNRATGISMCLACAGAKAQVKHHNCTRETRGYSMLESETSTVESVADVKTPISSRYAGARRATMEGGWYTPQNHRRNKETPLDLSYLTSYRVGLEKAN
ncbi:hypothetical protein THRCLA_11404 [Thraustotheca clavata]|uniref:START domain-containing protein n=1 Tax=Thraustotheca clavata TaxID=74557 RepID=A0A1V9Y7V0_9STRA|nr:hypothetical protein THRCLA_11404 [Thraustotheca clavata]